MDINTKAAIFLLCAGIGAALLIYLAGALVAEILSGAWRGLKHLCESFSNRLDQHFNTMVETSMYKEKKAPKKNKRAKKRSKVLKTTKRTKK